MNQVYRVNRCLLFIGLTLLLAICVAGYSTYKGFPANIITAQTSQQYFTSDNNAVSDATIATPEQMFITLYQMNTVYLKVHILGWMKFQDHNLLNHIRQQLLL